VRTVTDEVWKHGRFSGACNGQRLLFGHMYEDPAVERRIFPKGSRVFCIASAGCTAIALSEDYDVTAVDINPVQLEYAKSRAEGAAAKGGTAERVLQIGRQLVRAVGWNRETIDPFLEATDIEEQLGIWRSELRTRRFEALLRVVLSKSCLRTIYSGALLHQLPDRFDRIMLGRMERCFSVHPNGKNPYVRLLFQGVAAEEPPRRASRPIQFFHADAVDFLEQCQPGSFDGFTLSNILDGADNIDRARLMKAVRRAGTLGSRCVLRSFAQPDDIPPCLNLTGADRSFLWGSIQAPVLGD